jgi:hypothetical protein
MLGAQFTTTIATTTTIESGKILILLRPLDRPSVKAKEIVLLLLKKFVGAGKSDRTRPITDPNPKSSLDLGIILHLLPLPTAQAKAFLGTAAEVANRAARAVSADIIGTPLRIHRLRAASSTRIATNQVILAFVWKYTTLRRFTLGTV